MTFKELKTASGMSLAKLADYFEIPLRTVESWNVGKRQCNEYVVRLMAYKLKKEGIIKDGE